MLLLFPGFDKISEKLEKEIDAHLSLLFELNFTVKISLSRSLMVTLIARIFVLTLLASIVYKAKQKLENISQGKVVLSFL